MPAAEDVKASRDYSKYAPKGASSSGVEYISALADVFKPETKTEFRMVDTDVIQTRRTVIYEYVIKKDFSQLSLSLSDTGARAVVGSRGRLWIDRGWIACCALGKSRQRFHRLSHYRRQQPDRLRLGDHKRTKVSALHSEDTSSRRPSTQEFMLQSRNDVRFRSYQKYGAELKVIDEVGEDDEPPPHQNPSSRQYRSLALVHCALLFPARY